MNLLSPGTVNHQLLRNDIYRAGMEKSQRGETPAVLLKVSQLGAGRLGESHFSMAIYLCIYCMGNFNIKPERVCHLGYMILWPFLNYSCVGQPVMTAVHCKQVGRTSPLDGSQQRRLQKAVADGLCNVSASLPPREKERWRRKEKCELSATKCTHTERGIVQSIKENYRSVHRLHVCRVDPRRRG